MMRRLDAAIVAIVLLAACPHEPTLPNAPTAVSAFDTYWAPPSEVTYSVEMHLATGEIALMSTREVWKPLAPEAGEDRYQVTAHTTEANVTQLDGVSTWYVGPSGFGWLGETAPRDYVYDVPKLVLPTHPHAGMSWSAHHTRDTSSQSRTCEIRTSDTFCDNGIVVDCATTFEPGRVTLMRDFYCAGSGWRAQDSVVFRNGVLLAQFWTTSMTRAGENSLPMAPISERPLPGRLDELTPALR